MEKPGLRKGLGAVKDQKGGPCGCRIVSTTEKGTE